MLRGGEFLMRCLHRCKHLGSGWTCPATCCTLGHDLPCQACAAAKFDSGFYGMPRCGPETFECPDFEERDDA